MEIGNGAVGHKAATKSLDQTVEGVLAGLKNYYAEFRHVWNPSRNEVPSE
jgi:hypothetical protein